MPVRAALLPLALLLAAPAAHAADPDAIVVEGKRMTRPEVASAAHELVRTTIVRPELGQYARWNGGICPRVLGIADEYAAVVLRRVRAVVADAGARLAPDRCRPNLVIAFAPDAKAAAGIVARSAPVRLWSSIRPAERDRFIESTLPVRWIYSLGASGSDGPALSGTPTDRLSAISVGEGGEGLPGFGDAITTTRSSSSLVDTNLIVSIRGAFVLVDLKGAEGFTLASVSNYVARIALAQTPLPPRNVTAASILGLFADTGNREVDRPLTDWDRAFLKALYRMPPNRAGWQQRNRIVSELVNVLSREDELPPAP